jgi:hypothetical protein
LSSANAGISGISLGCACSSAAGPETSVGW